MSMPCHPMPSLDTFASLLAAEYSVTEHFAHIMVLSYPCSDDLAPEYLLTKLSVHLMPLSYPSAVNLVILHIAHLLPLPYLFAGNQRLSAPPVPCPCRIHVSVCHSPMCALLYPMPCFCFFCFIARFATLVSKNHFGKNHILHLTVPLCWQKHT